MEQYTEKNTLCIAKRFNNTKRTYLLVNPLQAKHIPVMPSESLAMMRTLGKKLASKYPSTKLIIGFAETATAIGAAVAESFSSNCIYVHTTREAISSVMQWIYFQEEHSHATEQKIIGDYMRGWLSKTDTIIFVDDEISTGKTLKNIIEQLRTTYPEMNNKRIVAASLLNRLSNDDKQALASAGITCEYLVRLPMENYSEKVEPIMISEAQATESCELSLNYQALFCDNFHDPRLGISVGSYMKSCENVAETFLVQFAYKIPQNSSVLVLGTEECMYPALRLAETLELMGFNYRVRCHATTRSPIGVSTEEGYPITSGHKLRSFFEKERETYIYNLDSYDVVIVVSDTKLKDFDALKDLCGALPNTNDCQIYYVHKGKDVWYTKR